MIKHLLSLLFFFSLFSIGITSCREVEKGGTIIRFKIEGVFPASKDFQKIKTILSQRLKTIGTEHEDGILYNKTDMTYSIKVPGIKGDIACHILSHGRLDIMEVYRINDSDDNFDITAFLDTLFITYPNKYFKCNNEPYILVTESKNIEIANRFIDNEKKRSRFPDEVLPLWKKNTFGGAAGGTDYSELYLAHNTVNTLNINKNYDGCTISKHFDRAISQLTIEFNDNGAVELAALTKKNIWKPLIFRLDNRVLMAPTIAETVEGGRVSIAGEFTDDELAIIKSLLSTDILEYNIEISDFEVKDLL